jgi:hypothetical protein
LLGAGVLFVDALLDLGRAAAHELASPLLLFALVG